VIYGSCGAVLRSIAAAADIVAIIMAMICLGLRVLERAVG
jgi:hypothetical protein